MKIFLKLGIIISLTLIITGQSYCQTTHKHISTLSGRKIKISKLDKFIQEAMDSLKVPGLSIAIINNARVVYYRAFGIKNFETKEIVDDSTIFEGASLSKPLFSYFLMKMTEKGVISLDTPLYKYLYHPGIKDQDKRYELITARMVLSHTTGFPNWSVDKPIEIKFTPGTDFSYSGEAHQYLTALLALQMKTNWQSGLDSIFQTEVAVPLGMKHTSFIGNKFIAENKASGHINGKIKELWLPKSFGGAHTLHTEALDFSKFLIAMIEGKGLLQSTFDEMLKEHIHFSKENELSKIGQTGWCLGFSMKPTTHGMRYLHTGNNTGFQSYCCFYKEKKYGLVFFTNCEKGLELYQKVGKYLDDDF